MRENDTIDLRNRMKTSFECLLMVAGQEYRRLKRESALRQLEPEEIDIIAFYEIYTRSKILMSKETFRRIVLSYFNVEL